MKSAFPAACIMAAALFMGGCEDKVNSTSYAAIQQGMALHEVEKIMGGKGEMEKSSGTSISGAGLGSSSGSGQAVYLWKKDGKIISVTVDNGKVVATGKSGF